VVANRAVCSAVHARLAPTAGFSDGSTVNRQEADGYCHEWSGLADRDAEAEWDFANLAARLRQNTVQEKLSNLWLDHLLNGQTFVHV